jgi:hypothetical protein
LAFTEVNSSFLGLKNVLHPMADGALVGIRIARLAFGQLFDGSIAHIRQRDIENVVYGLLMVHVLDAEKHEDLLQRYISGGGTDEEVTEAAEDPELEPDQAEESDGVVKVRHQSSCDFMFELTDEQVPQHVLTWPGVYDPERRKTDDLEAALGSVSHNASVEEAIQKGTSWGLAMRKLIPEKVLRINEAMHKEDFTSFEKETEFFVNQLEHFAKPKVMHSGCQFAERCSKGDILRAEARQAFFHSARDALLQEMSGEVEEETSEVDEETSEVEH